jgi:hypothetical protein
MNPADDTTAQLPPAAAADLTQASGEVRAYVPAGAPDVPGYDVLGEHGRGGMGVVYRAKQKGLNRVVALKMLLGGTYADGTELARFFGEAEVVAAVRHPNVIQVYEYGQHESRPFLSCRAARSRTTCARRANWTRPPRPNWWRRSRAAWKRRTRTASFTAPSSPATCCSTSAANRR